MSDPISARGTSRSRKRPRPRQDVPRTEVTSDPAVAAGWDAEAAGGLVTNQVVAGVCLQVLLPAEGTPRELDAIGTVQENCKRIRRAARQGRLDLADLQTLIRALWADLRELAERRLSPRPPAEPTVVVNYVTAKRALKAAGAWLEELHNPVLGGSPDPVQVPPGHQGARRRCRLRLKGRLVLLDGERVTLDLTDESRGAALCLLRHLLAAGGDWRSSTDLNDAERAAGQAGGCGLHVDVRWDRVRKTLPPSLCGLIESNRRKGYRLACAAWHR